MNRLIKRIVIVLLAVACIVVIYKVVADLRFRVTGTSGLTTYSGYLDIDFSKSVSADSFSINASPNIIDSYNFTNPKTLKIELNQTPVTNHKYSFTIKFAQATSGQILRNKILVLTAVYQNFSKLSKAQQQSLVNSQDQKPVAGNKLFSLLPYYSTYYYLQAQQTQSQPNILFTYLPLPSYLPAAEIQQEPTKQQAISQAEQWLTQKGINLSQYQIIDTSTNQPIN